MRGRRRGAAHPRGAGRARGGRAFRPHHLRTGRPDRRPARLVDARPGLRVRPGFAARAAWLGEPRSGTLVAPAVPGRPPCVTRSDCPDQPRTATRCSRAATCRVRVGPVGLSPSAQQPGAHREGIAVTDQQGHDPARDDNLCDSVQQRPGIREVHQHAVVQHCIEARPRARPPDHRRQPPATTPPGSQRPRHRTYRQCGPRRRCWRAVRRHRFALGRPRPSIRLLPVPRARCCSVARALVGSRYRPVAPARHRALGDVRIARAPFAVFQLSTYTDVDRPSPAPRGACG